MRLTKEIIERISQKIVHSLLDRDILLWDGTPEKLEAIIAGIITKDLMIEDKLNE